jgi:La-related protein 7
MDGELMPNTATATDFTPVGSPDAHRLPSDCEIDEVDLDHGLDHDHELEHEHELVQEVDSKDHAHIDVSVTEGPPPLTDSLKQNIIKQVEYYFSDENLLTDKYVMSLIKKNKEGYVPLSIIASFRKMKKLTRHYPSMVAALKESSLLVVSSNGKRVKRLYPLPFAEVKDSKLFTVLVENLPEDHSVENIRRIFNGAGKIRSISIRDPHAVEEPKKGKKIEMISSKLHALVEYETVEAAEKAAATFNNQENWRNGLRVKLLKQVSKYGTRRQAWRDHDADNPVIGQTSDQIGVEENNNTSQHHEDTHEEEDVDHVSKEKNGQRVRNRRPRRQNYRGGNGLGHGVASSQAVEHSKPPPGPKMPDGTRGFAMGRGRPLASSQN